MTFILKPIADFRQRKETLLEKNIGEQLAGTKGHKEKQYDEDIVTRVKK